MRMGRGEEQGKGGGAFCMGESGQGRCPPFLPPAKLGRVCGMDRTLSITEGPDQMRVPILDVSGCEHEGRGGTKVGF